MGTKQGDNRKRRRALSITAETSLLIVATLLLFAIAVGFASQALFKQVIRVDAQSTVGDIAEVTAECIDGDDLDSYLQSGGTDDKSLSVLDEMQQICDDVEYNYIYLIEPDLENDQVITSLSVRGESHSDLEMLSVGQVSEIENDDYRQSYQAIMDGSSELECVFSTEVADAYATAMVPVLNSNGDVVGIVCAECSFATYQITFYMFSIVLGIIAIAILVMNCIVSTILMRKRVARPIKKLSQETQRFADSKMTDIGDLSNIMARRNELGQLAVSVDAMEHEIVDSIESIKKMAAEQERINSELDIASKIQEAAMPHQFPAFPDRTEFDLYASMDPAKEVGGDFYDFFMIDDDHLALVIADVSGKGVPGALFMMVSKVMIGNYATMALAPAEILSAVNDRIARNNDASMFVTAWLGILEISTGTLSCCNAGHEYPAVKRAGGAFELLRDEHSLALGLMEGVPYSQYDIQLQAGDAVYVYTDGVPDGRNADGELYGTSRLVDALNTFDGDDAQSLVWHLKHDVAMFVGDVDQFDDFTSLAICYRGCDSRL